MHSVFSCCAEKDKSAQEEPKDAQQRLNGPGEIHDTDEDSPSTPTQDVHHPPSSQWRATREASSKNLKPFSIWPCIQGNQEEVFGVIKHNGAAPFTRIGGMKPHGKVRLRIYRAQNLPCSDTSGFSDPYVRISTAEGVVGCTKVKTMHCDPEWHEEFYFSITHPKSYVRLQVFDYDVVSVDDLLGELIFPCSDMKNGETTRGWWHLETGPDFEESDSTDHLITGYGGRIYIEMKYQFDSFSERILQFIPHDDPPLHLPKCNVDTVFHHLHRIKLLGWTYSLEHIVHHIDHITLWNSSRDSGIALFVFFIIWYYPLLALSTIFASMAGLLYSSGLRCGYDMKEWWMNGFHFPLHTATNKRRSINRQDSRKGLGESFDFIKDGTTRNISKLGKGLFTMGDDVVDAAKDGDVVGMGVGAIKGVGGVVTGGVEGTTGVLTSGLRGGGAALGCHVSKRAKATNVLDGVLGAGGEVFDGFDRGVKALVRNPLKDVREKGAIGLVTGLGKGLVEAGQGVVGGVINAGAHAVDGVAATPGALLGTIGLEKKLEEKEQETENLGAFIHLTAALLPHDVKQQIAQSQIMLHKITLFVEKAACVATWQTPDLSAKMCAGFALLTILSMMLYPIFYIVSTIIGWMMPEIILYYSIYMMNIFSAYEPSLRTILWICGGITGLCVLTCRTPTFQSTIRIILGGIQALTLSNPHAGIKNYPQYTAENTLPTSIIQFQRYGSIDIYLSEWLEKVQPIQKDDVVKKEEKKENVTVSTEASSSSSRRSTEKVLETSCHGEELRQNELRSRSTANLGMSTA